MATNSPNTKTFHLSISYLLMLSFLIQIIVILTGASTINSGETFLATIFFLEGIWLYFNYVTLNNDYISLRKPFDKPKTIYFNKVNKVELEGLDLRISDDNQSVVLPISRTLIKNLKDSNKEIPDLSDIKDFKMKTSKFSSMIGLQIFLITLVWSIDYANIGAIILSNIFAALSVIELVILIRCATTSISYNRGSIRVRGAFRFPRNAQWVQITSATMYSSKLYSVCKVYCSDKTLFVANNLTYMSLFLYLGQEAGWNITNNNN